jgi:REP element-mobilizing transposase RayT
MATHQQVHRSGGLFFCTFTCHDWIPLFEQTDSYQLVYDWLDLIRGKGALVHGYVIMPNHVHVLLSVQRGVNLNQLFSNGKRFIAYAILKKLRRNDDQTTLDRLKQEVTNSNGSKRIVHKAFRLSTDFRECLTEKFTQQKLDYIHANPVSGKWKLAEQSQDYIHSSASYYLGKADQHDILVHIADAMMFE